MNHLKIIFKNIGGGGRGEPHVVNGKERWGGTRDLTTIFLGLGFAGDWSSVMATGRNPIQEERGIPRRGRTGQLAHVVERDGAEERCVWGDCYEDFSVRDAGMQVWAE